MWDFLFEFLIFLLSVLLAVSSLQRWRRQKSVLYLLAIFFCLFTAVGSFLNPGNALFGLILPALLYLVAGLGRNKDGQIRE